MLLSLVTAIILFIKSMYDTMTRCYCWRVADPGGRNRRPPPPIFDRQSLCFFLSRFVSEQLRMLQISFRWYESASKTLAHLKAQDWTLAVKGLRASRSAHTCIRPPPPYTHTHTHTHTHIHLDILNPPLARLYTFLLRNLLRSLLKQ